MPYQIIYSSASTTPMQSEDLEELLAQARRSNGEQGISGALVYADGMFLQILEGDRARLQALMVKIAADVRHENVVVLRELETSAAVFSSWKMAYVCATPTQVASWAGLRSVGEDADDPNANREELQRTARFAQDILSLLQRDKTQDGDR